MPKNKQVDPVKMLRLSNALLDYQRNINLLEQTQIDVLGDGDQKIDDGELAKLNKRGKKILALQRELVEKTAQLRKMKSAYYQEIIRNTVFAKYK